MNKFTKFSNTPTIKQIKNDNIKYEDESLKVVEFDGWSVIEQKDVVYCVIYLLELKKFIIRQEYIPTFKYDNSQEYVISLVGGQIETGETPQIALIREIEEEAGIVLRPDFKIDFYEPLYISKSSTSKFYFSIITLNERDYNEISLRPKHEKDSSQTAKLDLQVLNRLTPIDIVTKFALDMFIKYLSGN